MALSAILPKNEHSERNLIFTVLSVTVLSTIAMIAYPILTEAFDFDDDISGVFLGGTIHDVAQVVGAGFSVSDQTGEVATLVKLIRVAMLAPVVLVISFLVRRYAESDEENGKRPPILPMFVVGFLIFATMNSLGIDPRSGLIGHGQPQPLGVAGVDCCSGYENLTQAYSGSRRAGDRLDRGRNGLYRRAGPGRGLSGALLTIESESKRSNVVVFWPVPTYSQHHLGVRGLPR